MNTMKTAALSLSLAGALVLCATPVHARSSSDGKSGNDSKKVEVKKVEPKTVAPKVRSTASRDVVKATKVTQRRDPPVVRVSKPKPEPKVRQPFITNKTDFSKVIAPSQNVPKANGTPNGSSRVSVIPRLPKAQASAPVPRPDGTARGSSAAPTPGPNNHHSNSSSVPQQSGAAQGSSASNGSTGGRASLPSASTAVPQQNGNPQGGGRLVGTPSQPVQRADGTPLGDNATGGNPGKPVTVTNANDTAASDATGLPAQRTRQASQNVPRFNTAPVTQPASATNAGTTAAVAAAAATIATGSIAASPALWRHNGSTMKAVPEGDTLRILYDAPRNGLSGLGIQPDTQLFQGRKTGSNTYAGEATTFSKKCGPANYPVSGEVSADLKRVTLVGRAPSRSDTCQITSYRDEALVFDLPATR